MESEIKVGDYIVTVTDFYSSAWGRVLRVVETRQDVPYPVQCDIDGRSLLFETNEVRPATDVEVLKAKLEGLV